MGSGKSSVLDGISFALFGTFPAIEHRRLSLNEVIMHGKNSAKIKLEFEWKREKYEILRTIELKKTKVSSDAEIRKEGKLMEKAQNAVTKYIEQLFQIDYDLFTRAIYSEQNNIDRFLNIDPARRKQEMDELLGLDKFETARSNTVTIINRVKSTRKAFEEKFNHQRLEEIRKKEIEMHNKCLTFEQKGKILSEEVEKNTTLYQQCNLKFSILKSKKEKADVLKQETNIAKGAVEQLKEQIGTQEWNEEFLITAKTKKMHDEKALEESKKLLAEFQLKQNALSKEAGTLESKSEAAKNAKSELESTEKELEKVFCGKRYDELFAEKQKLEQENIELTASYQSLFSELKKLEEGVKKITPTLSKCPLCRCALTKEGIMHVLNEYHAEIAQMKKQLDDVVMQKQEKTKLYSEIEVKIRKIESLIQKQSILEKNALQYETLLKQIFELQLEITKISESINLTMQNVEKISVSYQQTILECTKLGDILLKKKKLMQMELILKKNESELKTLEFNESEFESMKKELEEIRLYMEKAQIELNSVNAQLKDAREFFSLITSEREKMEVIEKQITSLLKLEEELSIYKNTLLETQGILRKEVIDSINTAMNGMWQIVYPYDNYKGLRMVANEKGYMFEIYDGVWRPAELISGGERASVALTFRIALTTVLTPNMNLLVLDEPTHNLDKEAVSVLAHALQYNLPELVEQSFIITHDEGLMGSEFASTYKMSRDKNSNAPTKIEEI